MSITKKMKTLLSKIIYGYAYSLAMSSFSVSSRGFHEEPKAPKALIKK